MIGPVVYEGVERFHPPCQGSNLVALGQKLPQQVGERGQPFSR